MKNLCVLGLGFLLTLSSFASDGRMELSQADFPVVITNSGSYILTQDVMYSGNSDAISINADHVSLDLNGFKLSSTTKLARGVFVHWNYTGASVVNGTVQGFTTGVQGPGQLTVQNVHSTGNSSYGIRIASGIIQNCKASYNGSSGIYGGNSTLVENCEAVGNSTNGFWAGISLWFGAAKGCVAKENRFAGFDLTGGLASECFAIENDSAGFEVNVAATLKDCEAVMNGGDGFLILSDYYPQGVANLVGCQASQNRGNGFEFADAKESFLILKGKIEKCVAMNNVEAGIYAGNNTSLHIDENLIGYNTYGIQTPDAGDLVTRNRATENTQGDYVLGLSTRAGQILDLTAGAIYDQPPWEGIFSANATATTFSPWANIIY